MLLNDLQKKGLINPPSWIPTNTCFLTIMGSHAYGVADTSIKSTIPDMDIYGFAIPPKSYLFPHTIGEIPGFGTPSPRFEQWQKPHILDKDAHAGHGQEYDFQVFSIVKFFELARQGNPNILDALFTREECVIHCTQVGRIVRDNRKLFVSKEVWPRMRGYAYSQMHKMRDKNFDGAKTLTHLLEFEKSHNIDHRTPFFTVKNALDSQDNIPPQFSHLTSEQLLAYYNLYEQGMNQSKRFEIHKFHGYDCKFAYHIIRLLDQCEQLMSFGEMDLQRAKDTMKSIRLGEWTMEQIIEWASKKEQELDVAFTNCSLPKKADEAKLKSILLNCLEEHYGTISDVIQEKDWAEKTLIEVDNLLEQVRQKLYK